MTISHAPYMFAVDQCDVVDKAKLDAFRAKRVEWVTLLEQDKVHSVTRQLVSLVWQDAVFRFFNEGWRLHDKARPTASMNSLLFEALTSGYVANIVLGVSRLTDRDNPPTPKGKNQGRNVVSLRRVFEDIHGSCGLITREVFVCYDGMVYDTGTIPPPWERGYVPGVARSEQVGGPYDNVMPELLHDHFDGLSGVPKAARSRTDVIADAAFAKIERLLSIPAVEKLRTLRNKTVAHAADADSRALASLNSYGLTLDDAYQALKALTAANKAIQLDLLWNTGGGVMPIPQFDVTEHLDKPYTFPEHLETLTAFWDGLVEERETWVK